MKLKKYVRENFNPLERLLFALSEFAIIGAYLIWDGENYTNLICSLVGVISVMFCIKGHPFGALLGIVFAVFYSITSIRFGYYGEFFTYAFMSLPMCIISFISWIRNPYKKGNPQVKVGEIYVKDIILLIVFAGIVTTAFYFILKYFNTPNLIISTISVTTSFSAVFLMYKRSPYYSLAYLANDLVLITLWILASLTDKAYITVVVCFVVFMINDLYGFFSWRKIRRNQISKLRNS